MQQTDSTDSSFPPLAATFAQQVKKPKYAPGQYQSHQPTAKNLELAAQIFNDTQLTPTTECSTFYVASSNGSSRLFINSLLFADDDVKH